MERLPIYIVPTPRPRARPALWRRAVPGVLLAALVLAAFAVGGAHRGSDLPAPQSTTLR